MIPKEFINELRRIVGERHVAESRTAAELYSYDGSLARGAPGAVVFPGDAVETAPSYKAAPGLGYRFAPRVRHQPVRGDVLPHGGLTICLSRLNRILGNFPRSRSAVVQPGVTNLELQNALAPLGFSTPGPRQPESRHAGRKRGRKLRRAALPQVRRHHQPRLGLQVVLADGEVLRLGGSAEPDPPGYDLRALLIGSEGTFAIVTEITVRIMPGPER